MKSPSQTEYLQRGKDLTSIANPTFDSATFLANAGLGRTIVELKPKQTFFCQGDRADAVFYLQKGRARVTVVSQNGKEATITLLSACDFVGEESLASIMGLHLATAYDLAGLVLVADAPGKLPKPLAELAQLISGGYPRTWRVPYVEAWRLGEPPSAANTPKVVARIGQDLVEPSRAIDLRPSPLTLNLNGANQ